MTLDPTLLRFGMLMRSPPDKTPKEPPRRRRDTDIAVLAMSLALLALAVLLTIYALLWN